MTLSEFLNTKAGGAMFAMVSLCFMLWCAYRVGYGKGHLDGRMRGMDRARRPIFLVQEGGKIWEFDADRGVYKIAKKLEGEE